MLELEQLKPFLKKKLLSNFLILDKLIFFLNFVTDNKFFLIKCLMEKNLLL